MAALLAVASALAAVASTGEPAHAWTISSAGDYTVKARRLSNTPVIAKSRGGSDFDYNNNPAAFTLPNGTLGLVLCVSNNTGSAGAQRGGPQLFVLTLATDGEGMARPAAKPRLCPCRANS